MDTSVLSAIILAAGRSKRLGRPKALLNFEGRTSIQRVLATLFSAEVRSGVVVLGENGPLVRNATDRGTLRWIDNPAPEAGRLGSLQCGISAVPPEHAVLLWPVDRPLASRETLEALLTAGIVGWTQVVAPESEDRRGHPILLAPSVRDVILAAPPDANLRDLLAPLERVVVPVDDPGIHFNLDTEAEYQQALAWWEGRSE